MIIDHLETKTIAMEWKNLMHRRSSCLDTGEDINNDLKDRFKKTTQNGALWDKEINIKLTDNITTKKLNLSNINFSRRAELQKHQFPKIYGCICPRTAKISDSYGFRQNPDK